MTYQVSENGITVNISDKISVFPDKTTPTPDDDGAIMYYELLNHKERKSILWREKLGEGLNKHLKDVTIPKAILTDFPQGYKLYAHRKKYPKKEERTDIYLFGRHRFRSPNEFIPHLIWLVSDKSGQCHCKYCYKSTTTNDGRKVPVPPATRPKRQRDVDTSDEAPRSKRITRSSSAKKFTDSQKRTTYNNRKTTTSNRRKTTGNRKKAAPYNRKKAAGNRKKTARKSSTKKRKPKPVELDNNIPPPVPKYAVFREGEIVWLVANKVLNDETLAKCNNILSIEHWPAIVGSITPQGDSEPYEGTIYTVKPLILHGNENVTADSLRPWLAYSSEESLNGSNRFTRSLLNIDLDKATPEQIVEIYFKAIQKASEIVKVFTPMYQYDYRKTKGIKEKHDGIHFKAMYFGAELIYEDDLVRLLPEDQADDEDQHKETYLQVTSIFEDKQGFQVTGDLYERGKLLEKGKYEWIPKNKVDEEYTINASDIAGRFYPVFPDITKSFTHELLKTFDNRMLMLGEDAPPTMSPMDSKAEIPSNTVTERDPDASKHLTRYSKTTTSTTTKQTTTRTSPLPPISTVLNGKRPAPFSLSQDEPSKRMMRERLEIGINEKTNSSIEMEISDEKEIITIKQTSEIQDIKSIEKGDSPVKFLDIEKRYTKKSEDIDLPPLVVSPDTPTFETDDEDVWSKINASSVNDSK